MTSVNGRRLGVAAAMMIGMLLAGAPAQATTVFFENFDTLNSGASASNYTGAPGISVVSGAVDLVHNGDNGILCPGLPGPGPNGGCFDLEGANGTYGRLQSAAAYQAHAGDTVTLSFVASGNQRTDPNDPGSPLGDQFFAGFRWPPALLNPGSISVSPDWSIGTTISFPGNFSGFSIVGGLGAYDYFRSYSISFVAPQDMMVAFRIGGGRPVAGGQPADDRGVLIDEVRFDITSPSAAPEPTTWAMMLAGFGMLGGVLRRRRAAYA